MRCLPPRSGSHATGLKRHFLGLGLTRLIREIHVQAWEHVVLTNSPVDPDAYRKHIRSWLHNRPLANLWTDCLHLVKGTFDELLRGPFEI